MEAIKITYDNIGNTLDIWFTKPTKNIICDYLDSDTIVKRDKNHFFRQIANATLDNRSLVLTAKSA